MTAGSAPGATHLLANLRSVQTGLKSRAAGIRHCSDCGEPFIDDHAGLRHCPGCRVNHRRYCGGCRVLMANTAAGERLCECCQDQIPLLLDVHPDPARAVQ